VEHHRLAISACLDVKLDAAAGGDRGFEGGTAILDTAVIMQAAMRERPRDQPGELRAPNLP
jgi:hypothetical protein